MRVRGVVSREVVCAVLRIETVNQTSRPWTVEPVRDFNRRPKGCDSSSNQCDPPCNLRLIDSLQGYAVAITVAVGGFEVIILEVDFSQQTIAIAARVTSKRVVRNRIDVESMRISRPIIHTDANEPGQRGDSFCSNAVPFVAVAIGSEEIHHRTCLQTVRPIRGYRASTRNQWQRTRWPARGLGNGVSPSAECPRGVGDCFAKLIKSN